MTSSWDRQALRFEIVKRRLLELESPTADDLKRILHEEGYCSRSSLRSILRQSRPLRRIAEQNGIML